ncbi:Putative LRR receptor-like serine/threonine-protein kinase [Glycine soja]|uniref:Putative LRR receptor-like serine/threonine-protein kinase n=1 Tax=Glycine soja TaxID=3848 RepID=A0A0B2R3N1_GLYSO|nr:Putative LRR receptor-like serine/threonine-protein kinase [Glycine soja]
MCIQTEREALLQFKAAIEDRYGMLSSWTTSDCCKWEGIRCSNLTGHVLMLDLHGDLFNDVPQRYMRGEIHKSLMELQQLNYLNLSWNYFSNRGIPEFLGSPSNLRYVDLSYCRFGGKIPTQFGSLSHLKYLNLAANFLEGSIPRQLGNLTQLQHLDLSYNSFEGSIPSQLGNLSNLQKLYLGGSYYDDDGALKIDDGDHWLSNLISLTHLSFHSISNLNTSHSFLQMIAKLPKLRELSLIDCSLSNHFILSLRPSKFNFSSSLSILDLSWNSFTSSMILQWLSNVTSNLVELDLSHNLLEGSTSNHFGRVMNSLEHLDLSYNIFKDSRSFLCVNGTVEALYRLDLSNNHFSGKIPDCWSHFKSLSYLDLSHNKFSGRIPTSMGSLFHLQVLLLRNNNLTDEIPFSLRSCTNLVMLDIAENRLSGLIPTWIGSKLQELQFLSLGRNNFHGSLPLKICYLSNIQLLDLSINNMSGKIPKCIKKFTSMTRKTSSGDYHLSYFVNTSYTSGPQAYHLNALLIIDLSSNHFSGEIQVEIENLFGLVSLNLSRNHLTGAIPSNIGKLTSLDFLDLSRNHLVGSIPWSLTRIDRLGVLDLSHNNLSGEIPTGTQLQSFNASCYEDNLDLCGPPLEKLCIDGKPAQEPIVKLPEDEKLLFTREFYMSMAIGFVISFWGVFGSILIKRSWRHAYFKFISNLSDAIYVMVAVKVFKWRHRG